MAKKGGQQQLQADLSTDEDFEKFLERPGLLVLDIYSEWCGPCLGMVGSLRKIKLELGGDNLHLAICKSDTITVLKRFNKKSEPTWMFVVKGKAVNLMFGTNVPKLMKLIASELTALNSKTPRRTFEIYEMQPEEVERKRKKESAIAEAERIELAEKTKKRLDYLTYVTDNIMENLPDIGVTVFGPQVNRDMYKKIMEPADTYKIQCKDRRVGLVTKDNFDVVNFACRNPLDPVIIEQLDNKELMMCFFKMPDGSRASVADTLTLYANDLMKSETKKDEDGEEHIIPPIISPMKVKFEVELQEGEVWEEEEELVEERKSVGRKQTAEAAAHEAAAAETATTGDAEAEKGEEGEEGAAAEGAEETQEMPEIPGLELDLDLGLDLDLEGEGEKEPEIVVEEPPKKRTRTKTVIIPPVWVPSNNRTHAALIYVFFRAQTTGFLPPDPVPEAPHIIMAFDAYKKKDLINLAERHKDDVMLYGFFTSDDAEEAKHIASSDQRYAIKPHTASDKIVFKVAKQTSHTMLSMATYGPSYVSPNTVIGKEEALKFFPEGYKTAEQEKEEALIEEVAPKKTKKGKKTSVTTERVSTTLAAPAAAAAAPAAAGEAAAAPPVAAEGAPPGEEGAAPPTGEAVEGGGAPEGVAAEVGEGGEATAAVPAEGAEAPPAGEEGAAPPTGEAPAAPDAAAAAEAPATAEAPAAETPAPQESETPAAS